MIRKENADLILAEILASDFSGKQLRRFAMEKLSKLAAYNWSGIYQLEGETLVLDEYVGSETDHTRIPVGTGVCGTAVATKRNQVIDDVRELDNYLACSLSTRSEIVVLIWSGEMILGQIDIDGHGVRDFDSSDEEFLKQLAAMLAERWD